MYSNSNLNYCSDYGSGSSSISSSSWPSQETWAPLQLPTNKRTEQMKSASFQDLVSGKCTLDDIMKEFQMNGTDSPFTPTDDVWTSSAGNAGRSGGYLRQCSWPAPERTPAVRLPSPLTFNTAEITTSTPVEELSPPEPCITQEQLRVLNSLPNTVLFSLLRDLEQSRDVNKRAKKAPVECRFCKNNGERESYYRSHSLKDGTGRVACPVLRAFVCARCGASGDLAHTIKYCPLTTAAERMKSAAMMRSVRMASGRRRSNCAATSVSPNEHYVVFGETTPSVEADSNIYNSYAVTTPLDPSWAALEQKLML